VGHESIDVVRSSVCEGAGVRPGAGRRIVRFGTCDFVGAISPRHEDHAVWEESCRLVISRGVEATGCCPGPSGGIIEFGTREWDATGILSPHHEHFAIAQKSFCIEYPR